MKNLNLERRGLSNFRQLTFFVQSITCRIRIVFSFMLSLMCGVFSDLPAQSTYFYTSNTAIVNKALQVGDTIPQELWDTKFKVYNSAGKINEIVFKDYKGKLILLDFWATWCPSCINGFPKMEELQAEFKDEVKVVLVNAIQSKDSQDRIKKVLGHYKNRFGYEISLDYLVRDSILQDYFPHHVLPHIIWIDQKGILRAASYSKSVSKENTNQALKGNFENIHQKQDYILDREKFLLSDLASSRVLSRSSLAPYIEGIGIKSEAIVEKEGRQYYQIWNTNLKNLYFIANEEVFRNISADRYRFNNDIDSLWVKSFIGNSDVKNKYCYEVLLAKGATSKQGRMQLSHDLLFYFGFKPVRTKEQTDVLSIYETTEVKKLISKGGIPRSQLNPEVGRMYIKNTSFKALYIFVAQRAGLPFEVISNNTYKLDLELPVGFHNYTADRMIAYLVSLGLKVNRIPKEIDVVQFVKI